MGSGLFWGCILIVIGISLIIKVVFNLDFPVAKVVFAFFFIFLGIKILMGNFSVKSIKSGPHDITFGEGKYVHERSVPREQNVIFGKGTFDFRNIDPATLPAQIDLNTVFGNSEIFIRKDMPVKITIDAAFAGVNLPDNNTTVFGSATYQTPAFDETKPYLKINADAVFGGLHVIAF